MYSVVTSMKGAPTSAKPPRQRQPSPNRQSSAFRKRRRGLARAGTLLRSVIRGVFRSDHWVRQGRRLWQRELSKDGRCPRAEQRFALVIAAVEHDGLSAAGLRRNLSGFDRAGVIGPADEQYSPPVREKDDEWPYSLPETRRVEAFILPLPLRRSAGRCR